MLLLCSLFIARTCCNWRHVMENHSVVPVIYIFSHLFSRGDGVHCINPFFFFLFFFTALYCFIFLYAWAPSLLLNKWMNEWMIDYARRFMQSNPLYLFCMASLKQIQSVRSFNVSFFGGVLDYVTLGLRLCLQLLWRRFALFECSYKIWFLEKS